MEPYKTEFIEFMVRCGVLTFGDFTAKSGRKTPYFVNAGKYRTGAQMAQLARFYARTIDQHLAGEFDVLFGPAYKGIPLFVATGMALHQDYGMDVPFCFNRKEPKDHGEGGQLVGHELSDGDRVLFIEDVTTAGTSIRETTPLLRGAAEVQLAGLVVSVDRRERGADTSLSALQQLGQEFNMKTCAIVTVDDIMEHLHGRDLDGRLALSQADYDRMRAYQAQYGA